MGNWEMSAAYLPDDESGHHVDGYVMHNDQEIIYMNGVYHADKGNGDRMTGDLELSHFPLYIINPFVPDGMVNFTGFLDGTLLTTGRPSKPEFNGGLKLDSVNMAMPDLSVNFRLDDKQVKIEDSRMIFDKFNIYTKGSTPFAINGYVDFSNVEKMMVDLRMKTNDYELMNAPKSRKAMTYGKIYVDVDAALQGPVDELVMRGNMNVLGKTDFTYV
jgi:autotransporter translocation and assembly factor TamB